MIVTRRRSVAALATFILTTHTYSRLFEQIESLFPHIYDINVGYEQNIDPQSMKYPDGLPNGIHQNGPILSRL